MIVKLLTEYHLEFISLKEGCRGLSESTHVKLLEISCQGSYGLEAPAGKPLGWLHQPGFLYT